MGLFDRQKSNFYEAQPLYTLGNNQSLLVVGLGNVGKDYVKTRHNVGFMAIDIYKESHEFSNWVEKKDLQCFASTGRVGSTRVILIKPTTLMNNSGESLQKVQQFFKIAAEDTLVVYDDLDVAYGTIRTRIGGSSAGHNGVKSLIKHTDKTFGRVRVGIGPKMPAQMDSADFVLKNFSAEQGKILPKILREISVMIDERTVGALQELTTKI